MALISLVLKMIAESTVPHCRYFFCSVFQSIENLSVESGGSGLEKDDSPGNMDLPNTPLYSDARL